VNVFGVIVCEQSTSLAPCASAAAAAIAAVDARGMQCEASLWRGVCRTLDIRSRKLGFVCNNKLASEVTELAGILIFCKRISDTDLPRKWRTTLLRRSGRFFGAIPRCPGGLAGPASRKRPRTGCNGKAPTCRRRHLCSASPACGHPRLSPHLMLSDEAPPPYPPAPTPDT
jgi:hypothetical protein